MKQRPLKRPMSLHRAHGLVPGDRYAVIPAKVAKSLAYRSLSASALRLLTLALTQYTGQNNGDIALTRAALKQYGYTSADTLNRALKQLRHAGLLELTRQGGLANGGKIPSLYALTWLPIPENQKLEIRTPAKASNAWATFKTKSNTGLPERVRTDPRDRIAPVPATITEPCTDAAERMRSGTPDTSLRSSPEGPPSFVKGT